MIGKGTLIVLVAMLGCGKGSTTSEDRKEPAKPKLEVKVRPRLEHALLDVTTIPGGQLTYHRKDDLKTSSFEKVAKHAVADAQGKARLVVPSIPSYLNRETVVLVVVKDPAPLAKGQTVAASNHAEVKWSVDDPTSPLKLDRSPNAPGRPTFAFGTLTDGESKIHTCPKTQSLCQADITPEGRITFDLIDPSATSITIDDKPVKIEAGRAHVELDYGTKIATSELATGKGNPPRKISIAVKVADAEGNWTGTIDLDPNAVLGVMMHLDTPGPITFAGDVPAPAKPATGVMLWSDGKTISNWVGKGKRPVDIDVLMTVAAGPRRSFSACRYEGGHTVERFAQDTVVRVRDRRSGKELARHTVAAKMPECASSIRARSPEVQKDIEDVARNEVIAWAERWLAR